MTPSDSSARGSTACPYLGRMGDADTHYLQTSHDHRCHATSPATRIGQEHQRRFCFAGFEACPSYLPLDERGERARPMQGGTDVAEPEASPVDGPVVLGHGGAPAVEGLRALLAGRSFEQWTFLAVGGVLLLAVLYGLGRRMPDAPAAPVEPAVAERVAALAATETPTFTPEPATATPTEATSVAPATVVVPTAGPGGLVAALAPSERGVGSWDSLLGLPTFGARELNVGRFDARSEQGTRVRRFAGGLLVPLMKVPPGSTITYAALELAGLSDSHLTGSGPWRVDMLAPEASEDWVHLTYERLVSHPTAVGEATWRLEPSELAARRMNVLEFGPQAIAALTERLQDGEVAFRISGPDSDGDDLFAWDTGYGDGYGTRPVLRVAFIPPPPTPGPAPGQPTTVPLVVWVSEPTPAPSATALPPMPAELRGRILFLSDRFGGTALMVVDPETGRVGQVTSSWPYAAALRDQTAVGDVSVSVAGRPCGSGATAVVDENLNVRTPADPARECAQLLVTRAGAGPGREITQNGFLHYEPALAPDGAWVAYVSTVTGNDELFRIRVDGSENTRLTENEWAWDKHPTWSPDGTRIAFWSNRDGHRQLYVMDADGGNVRRLAPGPYEDWDPVWAR